MREVGQLCCLAKRHKWRWRVKREPTELGFIGGIKRGVGRWIIECIVCL